MSGSFLLLFVIDFLSVLSGREVERRIERERREGEEEGEKGLSRREGIMSVFIGKTYHTPFFGITEIGIMYETSCFLSISIIKMGGKMPLDVQKFRTSIYDMHKECKAGDTSRILVSIVVDGEDDSQPFKFQKRGYRWMHW